MSVVRFGATVELVTDASRDAAEFKVAAEMMLGGTGRIDERVMVVSEGSGTAFERGDVLFGKLRPYLSKSWVADQPGEAPGDIHVYRPRPGIESRYIGYVVLSDYFLSQVNASTYGTKMPRANWEFIKTVPTMLPSQDEQRRIADYLDRETARIDTLIEKQRALLAGLTERRAVVIRDGVRGGPAMGNTGLLEDLPAHWTRTRLSRVATRHTGHTPSRSVPEYWVDTTIPWFTLADVWQLRGGTEKYLGETTSCISELGLQNSAAELLPAGTVVLSRTASVGFTGIMPKPMATSQDYWNWVCGPALLPEYLWNVFRAMRPEFEQIKAGSTHQTIYQADAAALEIPLPPLAEQREIADRLDRETARIDTLIAKAERFIELAQERRAALITAAVTGQLQIPAQENNAEEPAA